MASFAIVLCLVPFLLGPDVVYHISEVVVGLLVILMGIDEEVLRQLENDGDKNKQLSEDFVPQLAMEG